MMDLRIAARIALLTALSLILFLLEGLISLPLPVPGAKLGLAALVTLVALYTLPHMRDADYQLRYKTSYCRKTIP